MTFDRQLTTSEIHGWIEQAPEAEEQQYRAGIANAGYPIYLSEVTSVSFTDDYLFEATITDIQEVYDESNASRPGKGITYILAIATTVDTHESFVLVFSDYDTQWYLMEYGPDERYSNDWMPSVDEEKQAFNYSV